MLDIERGHFTSLITTVKSIVIFHVAAARESVNNSVRASESSTEAVKRLVANHENCSESNLGNLGAVVDVATLDKLRNPPIEFRYCGYEITVTADEIIKIEP